MSDDLTLWDIDAGRAQRDEAISRVEVTSAPWRAVAYDALEKVARTTPAFTSEEVWKQLDHWGIPRPEEGRAMGPVMIRGRKEGLIEPMGFTQSTNPKHHADPTRLYRSMVFGPLVFGR